MLLPTLALVRRRDAAQALLDCHIGQPFAWGTEDCLVVAADHLQRMGYSPPVAKLTRYRSANGARQTLKIAGFKSLAEALDSLGLPRIPPAAALPSDLLSLPGHERLNALCVALGNGRVLGFHEDAEGACVIQPTTFDLAWRVDPLG